MVRNVDSGCLGLKSQHCSFELCGLGQDSCSFLVFISSSVTQDIAAAAAAAATYQFDQTRWSMLRVAWP